jgi:hypothetical protein
MSTHLKTRLALSTAHHPQTDGQTERYNRTVEQMLRAYVNYAMDDWDHHLPAVEFAINNSPQSSTGFTPFQLEYGRDPLTPPRLFHPSPNPAADSVAQRWQNSLALAADRLSEAKIYQAKYANTKRRDISLTVGQSVLLRSRNYTDDFSRNRPREKLKHKYHGPYKVLARIGTHAYKLQLPPAMSRVHPVVHVSELKPYHPPLPNSVDAQVHNRPPPDIVEGVPEFEVEDILDSRVYRRQKQYLVKWRGYPEYDATWEPASCLTNCMEILDAFHSRLQPENTR